MSYHDPEDDLKPNPSRKNIDNIRENDNKTSTGDNLKNHKKDSSDSKIWLDIFGVFDFFCFRDHPTHGKQVIVFRIAFALLILVPIGGVSSLFLLNKHTNTPGPIPWINYTKKSVSEVTHYMAIDSSESARNDKDFQKIAQEYCKIAASKKPKNLQEIYYIKFASIQGSQESLDNCLNVFPIKPIQTDIPDGTSLINLIDHLLNITGTLDKDKLILMTILIHHEEPGPNQFNTLNPNDYNHLVYLLKKFSEKNIPITIISPTTTVIDSLDKPEIKELKNIRVCGNMFSLDNCIEDTYSSLLKIQRG